MMEISYESYFFACFNCFVVGMVFSGILSSRKRDRQIRKREAATGKHADQLIGDDVTARNESFVSQAWSKNLDLEFDGFGNCTGGTFVAKGDAVKK